MAVPSPHLHQHRLDNGLRVVLCPDRRLPRVAVNLLYRVGSRDDPPGRAGLAHLLEHLMFMGTRRAPGGCFDQLTEQVGGWSNAFTSEDVTVYYEVGPTRLLETLLWLEADRLAGLGPALTRAKLRLQRDVVLNELWQEYENTPYGMAELVQPSLLYPRSHPYAWPVIGTEESVRAITVGDVRRQLAQYYTPANASLVVAGDLEPGPTLDLVRRCFGWIRGAPPPEPRRRPRTPRRRREVRCTLHDAVELPKLHLLWHSPPHLEQGDAEMDLAAEVLASGKRSRLYRALVHERRVALRVEAYQMSRPLGSVFGVGVTLRAGARRRQVERLTRELLEDLASRPPRPPELRRARRGFETDFLLDLQQLRRRAELSNLYLAALGRPDGVAFDLERYRRAGARAVHRVCSAVLGRAATTLWVLPREGRA